MRTKFLLLAKIPALRLRMIIFAILLAFWGSAASSWAGPASTNHQVSKSPSVPWQANQVIKPAELAKTLSAATGTKPLVLCVGFPILYQGGHIVGAKFAGPAARPSGIRALKRAVQHLSHDKYIVLYCGCCPWNRCPNIRPAFRTMKKLGFTNVKVLSVPTNFRDDWVAKGFPIEKGPESK